MEKTHPAIKLMEAVEGLFASGADETNSEAELLALVKGVHWPLLPHAIVHNAMSLFEYTVDGPLMYRGPKLLPDCDRAFRLYQQTEPAQIVEGVTYQHSLELWISEEMELFVTSCFQVKTGQTVTEYRAWKCRDWLDTELEIDFPTLARTLNTLSELTTYGSIPYYEMGVV